MSDLARRNADAVAQALGHLTAQVAGQQARVDALQAAVSALTTRMAELERALALRTAAMTGHGPTAT